MVDPSNSSFIPKRGPAKKTRTKTTRQVYVFTFVSYIMLFATLLAAGGVYFYDKYINQQLDEEISALNSAISSFSESDMQRVLDFDSRLTQANGRLNNTASLVKVFRALEAATINTVKINSLDLSRVEDSKLVLTANIETDTFDSTIFQRSVFEDDNVVGSVRIESLSAEGADPTSSNIVQILRR